MTFADVLRACVMAPGFLEEFDRLHGTNLITSGNHIERAIDVATGKMDNDMRLLVAFVRTFVWAPLFEEGPTP